MGYGEDSNHLRKEKISVIINTNYTETFLAKMEMTNFVVLFEIQHILCLMNIWHHRSLSLSETTYNDLSMLSHINNPAATYDSKCLV